MKSSQSAHTCAQVLIILALLLAGCTVPPSKGTANPVYGPTWPRGTCNVIDTCWPVDGAVRR